MLVLVGRLGRRGFSWGIALADDGGKRLLGVPDVSMGRGALEDGVASLVCGNAGSKGAEVEVGVMGWTACVVELGCL